jgi:hypothetical protein
MKAIRSSEKLGAFFAVTSIKQKSLDHDVTPLFIHSLTIFSSYLHIDNSRFKSKFLISFFDRLHGLTISGDVKRGKRAP